MSKPTEHPTEHPTQPSTVTVVLPEVSDDQVSRDLRWLTRTLVEGGYTEDDGGNGLGGEFGYGIDYSNNVFTMMPYYWGDCECEHEAAEAQWLNTHDHTPECYQQVIRARGFVDDDADDMGYKERDALNKPIVKAVCEEMGLDPERGSYVHCTCPYTSDYATWGDANPHAESCRMDKPNFLHKPSGSKVDWYKYVGRGMELDLSVRWADILADCIASLD